MDSKRLSTNAPPRMVGLVLLCLAACSSTDGTSSDATNPGDETRDGAPGGRGSTQADGGGGGQADGGEKAAPMRWRTVEYTCSGVGLKKAGALPAGFIAADLFYGKDDAIRLNGHSGAESGIYDNDAVTADCGVEGNPFSPGTRVVASAGYPAEVGSEGKPLRWDTYDYACKDGTPAGDPPAVAKTGIAAGFVVASYTIERDGVWYLAPGGGWGAAYRPSDGALLIPCGTENAHPVGTHVRVAFGYPDDDAPELKWVTHRVTCGSQGAPIDVDTSFATATYSVRFAANGRWSLNPMYGRSSRIENGKLMVPCGEQNDLRDGTEALYSFGYR